MNIIRWVNISYKVNRTMFHFNKQQLNEALALNSFKDDIIQKTMIFQQLLYQFEKIEQKHQSPNIVKMYVKLSRKAIDQVTSAIFGIKSYMLELKLEPFYDLINKMYRLLIFCFNSISKKFLQMLNTNKNRNKTEGCQNQHEEFSNQLIQPKLSKNKLKELEYFDHMIKCLQNQQNTISDKKHLIQQELRQQQYISNISASDTVNQLDNLYIDLQRIINNSDKISGQNVLSRHQQLSNKIVELKKPDQIQNDYCKSISKSTKQTFMKTMSKIMKEFRHFFRQSQMQQLLAEIRQKKPLACEIGIQTMQADSKLKLIEQLQKQKKALQTQLVNLKKSNFYLQIESQKMQQKFKQMKQNIRNLNDNLNQISKKKVDYFSQKEELQKIIQMKNQEIKIFKANLENKVSIDNQGTQNVIEDDDSLFQIEGEQNSKFRSILRQKANSSMFGERQFQSIKKQNIVLRRCVQNIISKLSSLGLLPDYQNSQNTSTKIVILNQKIDSIVQKLSSFGINKNQLFLKQQERTSQRRSKVGLQILKVPQRTHFSKNSTKFTQTDEQFPQRANEYHESKKQQIFVGCKSSRLDALKQQFIRKITKKAKQKKQNRKLSKKHTLQQTNDKSDQILTMANNFKTQVSQDINPCKSAQKSRYVFQKSKKQILFEELKMEDNTNNTHSNKNHQNVKKNHLCVNDNPIHSRKYFQEKQLNKPVIAIENYDILRQLKRIMQFLLTKYENQDYYLQSFMKGLIVQFTKAKGNTFLQQILKRQLDQITQKQLKVEERPRERHPTGYPSIK